MTMHFNFLKLLDRTDKVIASFLLMSELRYQHRADLSQLGCC